MNIIHAFTHFGREMNERRISVNSEVDWAFASDMGLAFGFIELECGDGQK